MDRVASRRRNLLRAMALLVAPLIVGTIWFAIPRRPELPGTIWVHPGEPWCARCQYGVDRYTFRMAPAGPDVDPAWCFNAPDDGIELGPPDTWASTLVADVEREINRGERSYFGGVRYGRSGRSEMVGGHRWTEYRRSAVQR